MVLAISYFTQEQHKQAFNVIIYVPYVKQM